ncbi:MAG TPA: hypothetical protein VFI29_11100 [Hanamia sp.]|nr:hypothetical protein [Hanamia sp.]
MKKIISIFLMVLYCSASFAVTMDIHYCGEKYSSITFSNFDKAANCRCDHGGLHDRSCCTDKIICTKTDNYKTVLQYLVITDFPDFSLVDYFTDLLMVYPHPVYLTNHCLLSGFTRSHSTFFLTFLCTYMIFEIRNPKDTLEEE